MVRFGRYDTPAGIQGEFEPGSRKRVLKNLLGIKNKTQMDELENEAMKEAQRRYYEDGLVTKDTCFGASLIRSMHRDWLGSIYVWAGEYRTVDVSKDGFAWPPAFLVSQNMTNFESGVLRRCTPCRPGPLKVVCAAMAIVHSELLLIHPFREGNGRIARWLADLMAVQADLPLPFYKFRGRGSQEARERYLSAVMAGYAENYDGLARFFEEAILLRFEDIASA